MADATLLLVDVINWALALKAVEKKTTKMFDDDPLLERLLHDVVTRTTTMTPVGTKIWHSTRTVQKLERRRWPNCKLKLIKERSEKR